MALWQRIKSWFGRGVKAATDSYDRFKSWFEPVNIFTKLATGSLATNETIFSAVSRLSTPWRVCRSSNTGISRRSGRRLPTFWPYP